MSTYDAVKSGEIFQKPPEHLTEEQKKEWLKEQDRLFIEEMKRAGI